MTIDEMRARNEQMVLQIASQWAKVGGHRRIFLMRENLDSGSTVVRFAFTRNGCEEREPYKILEVE